MPFGSSARVVLLPECRHGRRLCIFGGRRRCGATIWLRPAGCGWRHARAFASDSILVIEAVVEVVVAAVADDLLVITRSHKTQLYLPTQSISQGTTTHSCLPPSPVAPQTGYTTPPHTRTHTKLL